jgi:hypothetical protein
MAPGGAVMAAWRGPGLDRQPHTGRRHAGEFGAAGGAGQRIADMSPRLAIGDFSRMTHLSVKALRHCHDVGLLTPAEIDPSSGYRFYVPGQVPIAQVIRRFRDLGMPLDQIREVLQAPDAGPGTG